MRQRILKSKFYAKELKRNKRHRNIYLNHFHYETVIELKTRECKGEKNTFRTGNREKPKIVFIVPKIIGYPILLFIVYTYTCNQMKSKEISFMG